jgi:hypothetical protein
MSASDIIAQLSVPERLLLFCVASGAEWKRAGIAGAVVTAAVAGAGAAGAGAVGGDH